MNPTVQLITLGVPDLAAARRFYLDGLGWQPVLDIPEQITFIQVGHGLLLGLFGAEALAADIGPQGPLGSGPGSLSLAQVVATEGEVGEVLVVAERAGGIILKPAQHAEFGGYHGYFADPAGFRWEIATNSGWSVDADGNVTLRPIVTG